MFSYLSNSFLDIVEGDPDKTRMFLDALASDEWEIIDDRPQKPVFDPDTCDLRYDNE